MFLCRRNERRFIYGSMKGREVEISEKDRHKPEIPSMAVSMQLISNLYLYSISKTFIWYPCVCLGGGIIHWLNHWRRTQVAQRLTRHTYSRTSSFQASVHGALIVASWDEIDAAHCVCLLLGHIKGELAQARTVLLQFSNTCFIPQCIFNVILQYSYSTFI